MLKRCVSFCRPCLIRFLIISPSGGHVSKGLPLHLWAVPRKPAEAWMRKAKDPSAWACLLLRAASIADAATASAAAGPPHSRLGHRRMLQRLRPQGSEIGECFQECDPKARKSANASKSATPRLGNRRMRHRLRFQSPEVGECFADCDAKARKRRHALQN